MQDAQHFDAIVIGGGPAGSTAARKMATLGLRTLVLERSRHPRYKACGGGVPARTVKLVGLSIEEAVEGEVSTIEVSHFGERSFRKHSAEPFAYMVMRDRFDALLLSAAAGQAIERVAQARAKEIQLVNEAAEKYFVGNAQVLKKLEVTQASLEKNSKVVLTEKGISPTIVLNETRDKIIPTTKTSDKE